MEASLSNGRPRGGEPDPHAHPHLRPAPDPSEGARGKAPEPQNPRMLVQPFLLLALEQWQSHGYELVRRLTAFGFESLDRGSVYRILRQLERDGLVISGWDTSHDGPARRLYTLTDAGRGYLEIWAGSLRTYQSMLDLFFQVYLPPRAGGGGANGAS